MEFQKFIREQLSFAHISKKYIDRFTDTESMNIFLKAFTHPDQDKDNNYQVLEYIGDGIIKACLSQYIPSRFPTIQREGIYSKIRRSLEAKKTLKTLADNRGFWPHVIAPKEVLETKKNQVLEDIFEAFIGAMVSIIDHVLKLRLGYSYAYKYLELSLNDIVIDTSPEALDDPVTRLNELYKASTLKNERPPLKWGDAIYTTQKLFVPKIVPLHARQGDIYVSENKIFAFTNNRWVHTIDEKFIPTESAFISTEDNVLVFIFGVYGFLGRNLFNIKKEELNRYPQKYGGTIIAQGIGFTAQMAKNMAAQNALNFLKIRGYEKA